MADGKKQAGYVFVLLGIVAALQPGLLGVLDAMMAGWLMVAVGVVGGLYLALMK